MARNLALGTAECTQVALQRAVDIEVRSSELLNWDRTFIGDTVHEEILESKTKILRRSDWHSSWPSRNFYSRHRVIGQIHLIS